MKKITLSVCLVAAMLSAKAQDTICIYFQGENVYEFNYYTNEVVSELKQTEKFTYISIDSNEVLCLHLSDQKNRIRKVCTYYPDGKWSQNIYDSKDNVYYSEVGPFEVEVGKPKFIIKQ